MHDCVRYIRLWRFLRNGSTEVMPGRPRTKPRRAVLLLALALLMGAPWQESAQAEEARWYTSGVRAGVSDLRNSEYFTKVEAFFTYGLPYTWEYDSKWTLGSFLGVNAGVLISDDDTFIASAGPGLYLLSPAKRVVLFAGIYATYIARSKLDSEDFGGPLQFISTLGIDWAISSSVTVGYSFQHMSNAGLFMENPGLNTHMVELSYRF